MKVIVFVIMFALFVAGMVLMGYAFDFDAFHGEIFLAGIIVASLGIAIPAHILTRID